MNLQRRFNFGADFVSIYIVEAHPADGWKLTSNDEVGVCYRQPKTLQQRVNVAREFLQHKDLLGKTTLLVDPMDDNAQLAYYAWPERLYIIQDGVVMYGSSQGPFGYLMGEVEYWLEKKFGAQN